MKKITAIFICLVLFAGLLSGCATVSAKDAYDLYQNMNTAMADVKSMDMDISANVNIEASGSTISTAVSGNMKTVKNSDTDVEMAMNFKTTTMGMDIPMVMYYTKGVSYVEASGMKYKMALSVEDAQKQMGNTSTLEFPESAIKDYKVTDVTGGKKINFFFPAYFIRRSF